MTAVSAPMARSRRPRELPEGLFGLGMVSPALLVTLALLAYPLLYSLWVSLHQVTLGSNKWTFVGLNNYAAILRDPLFLPSMGRTLTFAGIVTVLTTIMGLGAAL